MNRALGASTAEANVRDRYSSLNDAALMNLVKAANHDAFAELVSRHTANLFNLSRRTLGSQSDADDVVQAVLIKLWQRPNSWQASKSALSTWLYRVVLNACYDQSRAGARRIAAELGGEYEHLSPDVLDQLSSQEQVMIRKQQLNTAMLSLPQSQRDALNLAVFSGLPQKQVAQVLGLSVKAVESLLARAKGKLKLAIAKGHSAKDQKRVQKNARTV